MDEKLHQDILDENIKLHRIEAGHYEALHPEEYNWFEQGQILRDLAFIRSLLPSGSAALDLGCGTGNIFLKLLELGFEGWGVDISQEMLSSLERRVPDSVRHKATLYAQDIDTFIGACSRKFDLMTISSALHHLPDYINTLGRAAGLLNKGGYLYITHEPTKDALSPDPFFRKILWQLDNLLYVLYRRGRAPAVEARNYRLSDYHLYHGFNEDAVVSQCRARGLEVVKFTKYSSAMRLGISCWVDSKLIKSNRQFSLIARNT